MMMGYEEKIEQVIKQSVIEFEVLHEDIVPEEHLSNQLDVDWVYDQLKRGNEAAWFCAKVTLTLPSPYDESFSDYLGGCSYNSFEKFKEGEYYKDMVREVEWMARDWLHDHLFWAECDDALQTIAGGLKVTATVKCGTCGLAYYPEDIEPESGRYYRRAVGFFALKAVEGGWTGAGGRARCPHCSQKIGT